MYIPKDQLEVGAEYRCDARNFTVGCWDGEKFLFNRTKFNTVFIDHEYHWDEGPPFGTVKPLERVN